MYFLGQRLHKYFYDEINIVGVCDEKEKVTWAKIFYGKATSIYCHASLESISNATCAELCYITSTKCF